MKQASEGVSVRGCPKRGQTPCPIEYKTSRLMQNSCKTMGSDPFSDSLLHVLPSAHVSRGFVRIERLGIDVARPFRHFLMLLVLAIRNGFEQVGISPNAAAVL